MGIASLVVAIVALLIAPTSVAYTRRQAVAAEGVTAIESARRYAELTPVIAVTLRVQNGIIDLDLLPELNLGLSPGLPARRP